jgi:hypothetical protein
MMFKLLTYYLNYCYPLLYVIYIIYYIFIKNNYVYYSKIYVHFFLIEKCITNKFVIVKSSNSLPFNK